MRFATDGVPIVLLQYIHDQNTGDGSKLSRLVNRIKYRILYRNKGRLQEDLQNLIDRNFISAPEKKKVYAVNWGKFHEVVKKYYDRLLELPEEHPEHSDSIALCMALLLLEERMEKVEK